MDRSYMDYTYAKTPVCIWLVRIVTYIYMYKIPVTILKFYTQS